MKLNTGRLGRGRQGPYCETRRFILETWLDGRKKALAEHMAEIDRSWTRAVEKSGAANIVHREGAPALVVFNGELVHVTDGGR